MQAACSHIQSIQQQLDGQSGYASKIRSSGTKPIINNINAQHPFTHTYFDGVIFRAGDYLIFIELQAGNGCGVAVQNDWFLLENIPKSYCIVATPFEGKTASLIPQLSHQRQPFDL